MNTNTVKQIALPALGTQTTRFYLDSLAQLHQATHGSKTACPVVKVDVDFDKINAYLPDGFIQLTPLLENLFLDLEQTGASVFLVPNITLHVAIDRLSLPANLRDKIVHPLKLGIKKLQSSGTEEITLIGTRHTMQSGVATNYFEQHNIKVRHPEPNDIETLDAMRLSVYKSGVSSELADTFKNVTNNYGNVVIACTELSMLNTANAHTDLAQLHIEKAAESI